MLKAVLSVCVCAVITQQQQQQQASFCTLPHAAGLTRRPRWVCRWNIRCGFALNEAWICSASINQMPAWLICLLGDTSAWTAPVVTQLCVCLQLCSAAFPSRLIALLTDFLQLLKSGEWAALFSNPKLLTRHTFSPCLTHYKHHRLCSI